MKNEMKDRLTRLLNVRVILGFYAAYGLLCWVDLAEPPDDY